MKFIFFLLFFLQKLLYTKVVVATVELVLIEYIWPWIRKICYRKLYVTVIQYT